MFVIVLSQIDSLALGNSLAGEVTGNSLRSKHEDLSLIPQKPMLRSRVWHFLVILVQLEDP